MAGLVLAIGFAGGFNVPAPVPHPVGFAAGGKVPNRENLKKRQRERAQRAREAAGEPGSEERKAYNNRYKRSKATESAARVRRRAHVKSVAATERQPRLLQLSASAELTRGRRSCSSSSAHWRSRRRRTDRRT